METRLFWIGVTMGLYAWATRRWTKSGRLDSRKATAFWHALFYTLAGFAVTLIAVLSIESRVSLSAAPNALHLRELIPSLCGGILLGGFGFWRAWTQGTTAKNRRFYHSEDLEWAETIFSAIILAALLMYFVVQAFKIPSGSMERTLLIGDHLFVNKFIYGIRVPFTGHRFLRLRKVHRGDIVVFRFPTDNRKEEHCGSPQYGKDFIKRVIGIPGDRIEVKNGRVWRNGESLGDEPYARWMPGEGRIGRYDKGLPESQYQELWENRRLDAELGDRMRDNFGPVTVPDKSYFVMGDNRDRSCDSRFWGPVQEKYLKGRAWANYWPPSRMGRIK